MLAMEWTLGPATEWVPSQNGNYVPSNKVDAQVLPEMENESGESEGDIVNTMALLPKNTVVRIAGNNRTKASLVGQRAVVRRSIGLGGWHWLLLSSGEEVKLQRNALAVLEFPTHQEPESSASDGDRHKPVEIYDANSRPSQHAPPISAGCPRPHLRRPRHISGGFDAGERHRNGLRITNGSRANLSKLSTVSLRKYVSVHQLPFSSGSDSREDILDIVSKHFDELEVMEEDVIRRFAEAARRHTGRNSSLR